MDFVTQSVLNSSQFDPNSDPLEIIIKLFVSSIAYLKAEHKEAFNLYKNLIVDENSIKINDFTNEANEDNDTECVTISLVDQSNSHGIMSVMLFKVEEPIMTIAQWVISETVMKMNVHDSIIRCLQMITKNCDCDSVRIKFSHNERNNLFLNLLKNIGFKEIGYSNSIQWLSCDVVATSLPLNNRVIHVDAPDVGNNHNLRIIKSKEISRSQNHKKSVDENCDRSREDDMMSTKDESKDLVLRNCWYETLGVYPVNSSNFIHCGGNLVKISDFVYKLREKLELDIRKSHILQFPTFAELKELLHTLDSIKVIDPSINDTNQLRLSCHQKIILDRQEQSCDSTAYTDCVALIGNFGDIRPEKILQKLLERFPLLTSVITDDGNGGKAISNSEVENLLSLTAKVVVERKLDAIIKAKSLRPAFKLQCGQYLIKLILIEIKDCDEKMMVFFVHSLLVDDHSKSQIEEYLIQILRGNFNEKYFEKASFRDYCLIEKQYLDSSIIQKDLDLISNSFEEIQSITSLGFTSEVWSDNKDYECESKRYEIELNLDLICRFLDIQPFRHFLCCYLLTLKRYAAQDDLLTCVTINNRSPKFTNSFGPFVNNILYRIEVNNEIDLQTFMQNVASKWLQMEDFQQVPISKLLRHLQEKGKITDICYWNTFKYTKLNTFKSSVHVPKKHGIVPFSVSINENSNEEYSITLEWAGAIVDSSVAQNFGKSFMDTCRKVANEFSKIKNELISRIDVMSEREHNTILGFNRPVISPPNILVHRYFENHCNLNGQKTAINCGQKSFTYKQLDLIANKIAAFLQKTVHKEDLQKKPIVILMKRNELIIASMIAIWKIGGFFLTISEDMQQQLTQLEGKRNYQFDYLLTNLSAEEIYVEIPDKVNIINVTECKFKQNISEFEDRISQLDPKKTIAYMCLTSGTTGKPKCCTITHYAFSLIIEAIVQDYQLNTFNVSVLQFSPVCFDAFLAEVAIGLLSVCGSMTIVDNSYRMDAVRVRKLIVDHKISCCLITPQNAASLFLEMPQSSLTHFKVLIVGGEQFPRNLYHKIASKLGSGIKIINAYGMTETSIISTNFSDPLLYLTSTGLVPIGKPVVGANMFIVDPNTKLLSPIGAPGELCIAGPVVGMGDLRPHKLTVAGDQPVYMTGDKARWLPDGNIDYIGRDMLTFCKINGRRLNIREIEAVVSTKLKTKIDEIYVFVAADIQNDNILCLVYKPKFCFTGSDLNNEVRQVIKSHLPYYMMPNIIKSMNQIPVTISGKTDLNALRKVCIGEKQSEAKLEASGIKPSPTEDMLMEHLKSCMSYETSIEATVNFRDQGIHSLAIVKFATKLLEENVPGFSGVADLFDHPNIRSLAQKLDAYTISTQPRLKSTPKGNNNKVAIVGIAFKLPKNITTITEFADVLLNGKCLVDEFPKSRAIDYLTRLNVESYQRITNMDTFKASFLSEVDKFDHKFFDILPTEAKHMCVEQRLLMEVATEAITGSGHISTVRGTNTGVFVSRSNIKYNDVDGSSDAVSVVGRMASFVPTRIAYHFDLKGPTVAVDTACSSGLVSLHQACEAIKNGQCEAAIVAGISIFLYPAKEGTFEDKMMTLSPDACCRAFDANANGAVPGEGVIAFVIEPLKKAIECNRFIYGVIESTAVNSVGRGNGITAPSVSSQKQLITDAIKMANMSTNDINLIETHGTGTQLGDVIELTALKDIFKENHEPVFVGATKPNFGHLNEASGLLGILKILTTFLTQEIPPLVNFKSPNSVLLNSNLIIPEKAVKLKTKSMIAGVSSFGLSGTNSHVILSARDGNQSSSLKPNLKSNVLLFRFNNFIDFEHQIDKYYFYVKSMIIDRNITSIEDMCATVARKLRINKQQNDAVRVALRFINEKQALSLLSQLRGIDEEELKRLSEFNTNVFVAETGEVDYIDNFIKNGFIDIGDNKESSSPCVPVTIFNSVRHWPEPRSTGFGEEVKVKNLEQRTRTDVDKSAKIMSYDEILTSLKEIWISVLGVEDVDEDDIFRELGGESLLVIEMMQKVRKEIGVQLDLGHCYAYPSLKQLSNCVKSLLDESYEAQIDDEE